MQQDNTWEINLFYEICVWIIHVIPFIPNVTFVAFYINRK